MANRMCPDPGNLDHFLTLSGSIHSTFFNHAGFFSRGPRFGRLSSGADLYSVGARSFNPDVSTRCMQRRVGLLRGDYLFDASHKLCDVGALLDALAFLQVLECRLELGLRDCGAGEAH
jgi:hypothetical protein